MYSPELLSILKNSLDSLNEQGAYKTERILESPQGPWVTVGGQKVLMLAANNYLGLASHPEINQAAKEAVDQFGYGMASVRFICGTTSLHKELEEKIAQFLGTEDALLFSSCFSANEAFFAAMVNNSSTPEKPSVIYSDQLNHASIIDGLQLVKKNLFVKRIYPHNDLEALRKMLAEDSSADYQLKIIVTDGVFSMEGELAKLPELIKLAEEFGALLFVDDSHGIGACGPQGKGSPDELEVSGQIDVLSGTLGKALGGAAGGYLAGSKKLIEFLRQKARPYIFSNSLPPMIVKASLKALELLSADNSLIVKLKDNTKYFRDGLQKLGFEIIAGDHPIVPIMIKDTALTQKFSQKLLEKCLYIVGLWFPVVPEGEARLRAQISAAHTKEDLDKALAVLAEVGRELNIIN